MGIKLEVIHSKLDIFIIQQNKSNYFWLRFFCTVKKKIARRINGNSTVFLYNAR